MKTKKSAMTVVAALAVLAVITLAALAVPATAKAAPARPQPLTLRQPDGSTITLQLRGDEFFHYVTDLDGQLLLLDETGFYRPATAQQQAQWLSDKQAGDARRAEVNAQRRSRLRRVTRHAADSIAADSTSADSIPADTIAADTLLHSHYDFPSRGKIHGLVLLVEYQDVKFTIDNPYQEYHDMMTREGYDFTDQYVHEGSAHDYFMQCSGGQFDPQFDVFGPLTLSHDRAYYGKNSGGNDSHPGEMVVEGCKMLEDSIDFTLYDNDDDGIIDFVFLFFAGPGENAGGVTSDAIWPHQWDIVSAGNGKQYVDGKQILTYACTNELYNGHLDGVGTFCHEFSHVLGLPDIYDTSYQACVPGNFDVLATGCYNEGGYSPAAYTAFERYELGWLQPTLLADHGAYTLHALCDTMQAYIAPVTEGLEDPRDGEYFLFENRQQRGWDKKIPGHGMLAWHIDYVPSKWDANNVNSWTYHQCIDLVEADGQKGSTGRWRQDGSATFPGTAGHDRFTSATAPAAFCGWRNPGTSSSSADIDLDLALIDITETDEGLITFDLVDSATSLSAIQADPVTAVSTTRKAVINGRLVIITPTGTYSPEGVRM